MTWLAPGMRDLIDWQQAALTAADLQREQLADEGVILLSNWSQARRIAWPRTVEVLDNCGGQFVGYWYGEHDPHTRDILVRDNIDEDKDPARPYSETSLHCTYLQDFRAVHDNVLVDPFYFYRCAPVDNP
jgi:hypothetical protein